MPDIATNKQKLAVVHVPSVFGNGGKREALQGKAINTANKSIIADLQEAGLEVALVYTGYGSGNEKLRTHAQAVKDATGANYLFEEYDATGSLFLNIVAETGIAAVNTLYIGGPKHDMADTFKEAGYVMGTFENCVTKMQDSIQRSYDVVISGIDEGSHVQIKEHVAQFLQTGKSYEAANTSPAVALQGQVPA